MDAFIKIFLVAGEKMALLLDDWENVNHEHLVNFLVVIGEMALFLASKMIGDVNQTADNQATMVESILSPYEGVDSFAAVATDNTQSCLNMRDVICDLNPGIVGLRMTKRMSQTFYLRMFVLYRLLPRVLRPPRQLARIYATINISTRYIEI